MFFKRKKKNRNENPDLVSCQSPDCPTPEMTYPKENCFTLDGLILCQFCFTKKLSENPTEINVNESKTKKVDNIKLNRITPNQLSWDIKNKTVAHLSRIGPSSENEKYIEGLSNWKDILKQISLDQKYQQMRKISRLSQVQHTRLIETSGGNLLISFVSNNEYKTKIESDKFLAKIFNRSQPETLNFEVKNLSKNIQEWISNNKLINETSDLSNNALICITVIEQECFTFEEITEHLQYIEIEMLLYELGRFFYYLNFMGYSNPFQIFVTVKDKEILFHHANFTFNEKTFSDMKAALQYLYLVFPTMLDENFLQKFTEGAATEQKELETMLKQDESFRDEVIQFFKAHSINFDYKKPLPSLDLK